MYTLLVLGLHGPYSDYILKRKGVPMNFTILMTFMKKKIISGPGNVENFFYLFPIDFSFSGNVISIDILAVYQHVCLNAAFRLV